MTDPKKNELLSELWNDAGAVARESALREMIAEGRRRRARCRTARAAIVTGAVIAGGLCLWPRKQTPGPQAAKAVATQVAAPSPATPAVQDRKPLQLVEIHYLTPAETEERLGRLKGYAYARVGAPGQRRMVLLEKIEK